MNYTSAVSIANAVVVPLCDPTQTTCTFDFKVRADVNGAHLVADVMGYFTPLPPLKAIVAPSVLPTLDTIVGTACTNVSGIQVTISVPAPV